MKLLFVIVLMIMSQFCFAETAMERARLYLDDYVKGSKARNFRLIIAHHDPKQLRAFRTEIEAFLKLFPSKEVQNRFAKMLLGKEYTIHSMQQLSDTDFFASIMKKELGFGNIGDHIDTTILAEVPEGRHIVHFIVKKRILPGILPIQLERREVLSLKKYGNKWRVLLPETFSSYIKRVETSPVPRKNGNYVVRLGSFKEKQSAEKLNAMLRNQSFSAVIVKRDQLYRVEVGFFKNKADAKNMQQRITAAFPHDNNAQHSIITIIK